MSIKGYFRRLVLPVNNFASEFGRIWVMFMDVVYWTFRRPFKFDAIFKQMEFIGVKSLWVVIVTGGFTGMVLALQTYYGFRRFSSEGLVGTTVALSMTRELGPVLTGLMVTGRAGSAIAAELGTMRVTEQIDALTVMALNPVKYLVVPRVLASLFMLPILTIIADFTGIVGGYFIGVKLLGINEGIFISRMVKYVDLEDIYNGLAKAACFGVILAVISCYQGFYTRGGAEGVGRATTQAVVVSSITILVSDYVLTSLMF
ncbi:MAG: putative phospholipid ABC transporter permease protein MlaE [Syntrophorhabdaceae bacterium PtaU1.Bin034]|nr:MAG: putative phospholipid ABC transporter permease protein MlaE [Syntrophorhabdaceae bacterium PtaU1.Bin034]